MYETLFHIGKLPISSYGVCIAIGILGAYFIADYRTKKRGEDRDVTFDLTMIAAIAGFIGAKILYYIVEFRYYLANPKMLLHVEFGFVAYGGIIGGSLACIFYLKRHHLNVLKWFDLIMPEIAFAQAFGRIGCLMAGCCYGAETDSWFHIIFHNGGQAPNNIPLYPTQIMSAAGNLLNFFLLVFVIGKFFKKPGMQISFYLIFYSIGRYIVELFRDDDRGNVGIFSTSQFISLFILAAGIVLFVICLKRKDAEPVPEDVMSEEKAEIQESDPVTESTEAKEQDSVTQITE